MNNSKIYDPLGIEFLHREIAILSKEYHSISPFDREKRIIALEELSNDVLNQYQLLKDRYALMKSSNRMLFEELAWLRDQCDDFSLERSEMLSLEPSDQSIDSSQRLTEDL